VHLTSGINFHYHGGEFIETQSASGATRRYVHGPGTDEPLVWYEGAGTTDRRYLHADERGSIVAVSDDSGNVIGINKYDEYGVPAATNVGSFGYTGQVWLPELGQWHYKARMYDPRLGRFLQPDPIGYGDGMNMYAYVGGDPVNFTDPLGLVGGERAGGPNPYVVPILPPSDDAAVDGIVVTGQRGRLAPIEAGAVFSSRGFSTLGEFNSDADGDGLPDPDIVVTGRKPKRTRAAQASSLLQRAARCTGGHLGLTAGAAGAVAVGQPIPGTKPFVNAGSSRGTSVAGLAANAVFGKARLPFRLPTIVGGIGTGTKLRISGTISAARFAGRAVPILGWGLLAYDAISIAVCTYNAE
jgi:RHS repeat-associated protein